MRRQGGQASLEYVVTIALVACVLASAAVAVAAPELPGAVVRQLRLGLCIVGADVCRESDAADRGLEPCVVAAEEHLDSHGLTVLFLRASGDDFWTLRRRSDGRLILTEGTGGGAGLTAGVGFEVGPVSVGGDLTGELRFREGRSWVVTEAQLRSLLELTEGDPSDSLPLEMLLGEPAEQFLEGGGDAETTLAFEAEHGAPTTGAEIRTALGRRTSPDGTTYYFDLGAGLHGLISETLGEPFDGSGNVVAEYRASEPPVITLRATTLDPSGDQFETVARLALATPEDVAAAERVALVSLGDPLVAVKDLVARIEDRGTVERLRYRTRTDASDWAYGASLLAGLGIDHAESHLYRVLVDAQVVNGPVPATRYDCLGGI